MKMFTNYVEKVRDVECEKKAKMFHIQCSGQTMKALMKVKSGLLVVQLLL